MGLARNRQRYDYRKITALMTFDQLTWHDGASSACGRPGGVSESIDEKDAVRAREVGHELVDEVPSGDGACCERSVLRWKEVLMVYSPPMITMFCVLDMASRKRCADVKDG